MIKKGAKGWGALERKVARVVGGREEIVTAFPTNVNKTAAKGSTEARVS